MISLLKIKKMKWMLKEEIPPNHEYVYDFYLKAHKPAH
jgi:hypothetical protein